MTIRDQHVCIVAILAVGALTLSACSGSGSVTDPAGIDRPDVEVDVYEGAACEAVPQEVVDRYIPDAEPLSLDTDAGAGTLDAGELLDVSPPDRMVSSCALAEVHPTIHLLGGTEVHLGTEILVRLYSFEEPQRAREDYERGYDGAIRPVVPAENGIEYGPVHEIAIGDQGFMHSVRHGAEDAPAAIGARAEFIAGDTIAEISIARGIFDPWTEDEVLAALSDVVAAFGT